MHDLNSLDKLNAMNDGVAEDTEPEDHPVDVRNDVAVQPVTRGEWISP